MAQTRFELEPCITIKSVQDLYHQLHDFLIQKEDLVIDASKLSQIDTAGAQLLFHIEKMAEQRLHPIIWENGTPALKQQLEQLGINIPQLFKEG